MMTIYLAPLTALVGILMYGFAGNSKLQEIGRIMFAFGLLATLMETGSKVFHF